MTAERIKITYATLRADNEDLQVAYEAGLEKAKAPARRVSPQLRRRPGPRRRRDVRAALADRQRDPRRDVRPGHASRRPGRDQGRAQGAAGLVPARLGEAARDHEACGGADLRAPDGVRGPDGRRGRQDAARGPGRGRGGGRPHPLLRQDGRGQRVLRPPAGQPRRRDRPHPDDPAAARGVRGDQPVQLPDGAVRRPDVRGDDGRQHGDPQAGLGRRDDRDRGPRGLSRRRGPGRRVQPRHGPGRHGRRRAPAQPGHRRDRVHGLVRGRVRAVPQLLDPVPAAVHRRDGRQEPGDRAALGGPRGGGRGDHAGGVRVRRAEVLREQPGLRREARPRRARPAAGREDREAHGRRPAAADGVPRPGHRPARGRPAPAGGRRGPARRHGVHRRRAPDRRRPRPRLLRRADGRRQAAGVAPRCSRTSCSRRSRRSTRWTRWTRRSRSPTTTSTA